LANVTNFGRGRGGLGVFHGGFCEVKKKTQPQTLHHPPPSSQKRYKGRITAKQKDDGEGARKQNLGITGLSGGGGGKFNGPFRFRFGKKKWVEFSGQGKMQAGGPWG